MRDKDVAACIEFLMQFIAKEERKSRPGNQRLSWLTQFCFPFFYGEDVIYPSMILHPLPPSLFPFNS